MTWIKRTEEPPERRPTDIVRAAVGVTGVALAGLWSQASSSLDTNIFKTVNDFPNSLENVANAFYSLGSIWAVIGVALVLLLLKKVPVALHVALAGVLAWGVGELLHEILDPQSIHGLGVNVRTGDGPIFPSTNVAVITTLALVLAPYVVRPLRRVFLLLVLLVALSAMYLATAFPSDVLGGIFLGFAAAGLVLAVFGAPGGRPTLEEVRDGLVALGFDVAKVTHADDQVTRAAVMDVRLTSGERLRVDAYGRDQRDGQVAAKVWHWIMYRDPGVPVFGSRLQQTEHIGYALMLAERAKVPAPHLVKTGAAGPEAAMLVTSAPDGTPLDEVATDAITDGVLASAWKNVKRLHGAGISHGTLDAHHVLIDGRKVSFDDFSAADANADQYWINRDSAGLLVATALLIGNDRAVKAATAVLGKDRVAELIPFVQPAALPNGVDARPEARREDAEGAPGRRHRGHWCRGHPTAQDQAPQPRQHRDARGRPARARDRDSKHRGRRLGHGPEAVRDRRLGLGRARVRALASHSDGLGNRAHGLRQQGPPLRADRDHADLVHVLEPHHAERDRWHRAAARLPAPPGRAHRVRRQRHGAQHRRRRRDPDDPLPHRRGADRDDRRHEQQQQRRRHHARSDRGRGRARRRGALHPQDPGQGGARGEESRE